MLFCAAVSVLLLCVLPALLFGVGLMMRNSNYVFWGLDNPRIVDYFVVVSHTGKIPPAPFYLDFVLGLSLSFTLLFILWALACCLYRFTLGRAQRRWRSQEDFF